MHLRFPWSLRRYCWLSHPELLRSPWSLLVQADPRTFNLLLLRTARNHSEKGRSGETIKMWLDSEPNSDQFRPFTRIHSETIQSKFRADPNGSPILSDIIIFIMGTTSTTTSTTNHSDKSDRQRPQRWPPPIEGEIFYLFLNRLRVPKICRTVELVATLRVLSHLQVKQRWCISQALDRLVIMCFLILKE